YQGFAWGFGLERLLMMRNKITDIRFFHSGDIRFIKQF
ncbi:MAG TPA: phenylalanine--tRNA ligase subunit alpha, partial [Candidatus Moranbacteria bacterium]|nr:phenylalanine--tRNA ligase subunit alpha [Candidatus Moranbacteria bacterium]